MSWSTVYVLPAVSLLVPLVIHIFTCIIVVQGGGNVKIKIVDAPSTHIQPYSSSAKKLTLRVDPAPISGPMHLWKLSEECFKAKEKGYEYTVCPFNNVTQREERFSWNSFHGVLGVWNDWIIENDTVTGMHFTMGERCGLSDREANVMLNCSTHTRLHSMSEQKTCIYNIWMDTPLACLKGSMQVYHLLTESQLQLWKIYEKEYFKEEITFQGLTKQRRKILTEVGLLRPFKPPEEKATIKDNALYPSAAVSSCEKEKEKLQNDLKVLQDKVDQLIQRYPNISRIIGFTSSNNTNTLADGFIIRNDSNTTEPSIRRS